MVEKRVKKFGQGPPPPVIMNTFAISAKTYFHFSAVNGFVSTYCWASIGEHSHTCEIQKADEVVIVASWCLPMQCICSKINLHMDAE